LPVTVTVRPVCDGAAPGSPLARLATLATGHLEALGLIDGSARTVSGWTVSETLDWWRTSERRQRFRRLLTELDGVDPDDVILEPGKAARAGLTRTLAFPRGNLAPEGSVVKATAIDPSVIGADGVYRHEGPARVFTSEKAAIAAIKEGRIVAGDVMILAGVGPMGTGMEETYQVTSALKHIPGGNRVALITDARFSGVSTGACIGHVGPEALAGGPLGKLLDAGVNVAIGTDGAASSAKRNRNSGARRAEIRGSWGGRKVTTKNTRYTKSGRRERAWARRAGRRPSSTSFWRRRVWGGIWRGRP
jgi:dihydroxyacid dehydratase/phosphogluconate dehydratase